MTLQVVPYDPQWLPQLAALARAHARLVPPWISLDDEDEDMFFDDLRFEQAPPYATLLLV